MTAARTKQHEGKDTGIRKEKIRIVGSKAKKGKKILLKASMSIVTKASRLFYKAEPGTLSHDLPSSSYSRRQRYQVSELQLLSSPSVNKLTRTKQYYQDSEDVATHVFHVHIYTYWHVSRWPTRYMGKGRQEIICYRGTVGARLKYDGTKHAATGYRAQ